jgi:DNA polymerase kappa
MKTERVDIIAENLKRKLEAWDLGRDLS